jgi:hypothetical protein
LQMGNMTKNHVDESSFGGQVPYISGLLK